MEEQKMKYKSVEKLELKDLKGELPKAYSKVHCPSCNEEVAADNLNLQNTIAKCNSCNVLFSLNDQIKSLSSISETRQEVLRPEGIDMFYYKNDLDITIQQHIQGLDMAGLIFAPTLAFFSIILFVAGKISAPYFPVASVIMTLYFIYRAYNYSKNKTYIDVNNKYLSIKNRPKHFKKDRTYYVEDIDQLYIKHAVDGSGYFTIQMIINGLEGQKHVKLLTVNTLSKAKYLEQEIERYLDIENRKVPEANA
ncbi:MAG: hypothetical protein KJO50_05265 [Bacteroidia bacterium]|nr:hypothetical protein [Bacteroidia bacterium]